MRYSPLGRTGLSVSRVCLGTMTFGEQNSEQDAHRQLDYAVERGINFIDTAEMYPVPPRAETQGRTEAYIGTWLNARRRRDDLVIATKVVGPVRNGTSHIRPGKVRLDRANIEAAIEASLKRLQTDYVDLYQLHWPDRHTPIFGQRVYEHVQDPDDVPIEETLAVLGDLVASGKVRFIGLSNETPWGVMRFLEASGRLGLPRVQHPEPIQPGEPDLRERPGRDCVARGCRPAALFAPGVRHAQRQIPGWCPAGGRADDPVQPLHPL
jgi:aryl-alcohol dehydrogenase-like predicted oxidoreductase